MCLIVLVFWISFLLFVGLLVSLLVCLFVSLFVCLLLGFFFCCFFLVGVLRRFSLSVCATCSLCIGEKRKRNRARNKDQSQVSSFLRLVSFIASYEEYP